MPELQRLGDVVGGERDGPREDASAARSARAAPASPCGSITTTPSTGPPPSSERVGGRDGLAEGRHVRRGAEVLPEPIDPEPLVALAVDLAGAPRAARSRSVAALRSRAGSVCTSSTSPSDGPQLGVVTGQPAGAALLGRREHRHHPSPVPVGAEERRGEPGGLGGDLDAVGGVGDALGHGLGPVADLGHEERRVERGQARRTPPQRVEGRVRARRSPPRPPPPGTGRRPPGGRRRRPARRRRPRCWRGRRPPRPACGRSARFWATPGTTSPTRTAGWSSASDASAKAASAVSKSAGPRRGHRRVRRLEPGGGELAAPLHVLARGPQACRSGGDRRREQARPPQAGQGDVAGPVRHVVAGSGPPG